MIVMSKALDKVWHEGLIYELKKPWHFLRSLTAVKSFLV